MNRRRGVDDVIQSAAGHSSSPSAHRESTPKASPNMKLVKRMSSLDDLYTHDDNQVLVELAAVARDVLELRIVSVLRVVVIGLAVLGLCYIVSPRSDRDEGRYDEAVTITHFLVDSFFIAEGVLRFFMSYSLSYPPAASQTLNQLILRLRAIGLPDVGLSVLVMIFATGDRDRPVMVNWLRLLRLLLLFLYSTAESPSVVLLVGCVRTGLRAARGTVALLLAGCFIHATVGVLAFRQNDPLHFGSLPAALWTSMSMCSLDAWSDVFYINYYGCDSVPSVYQLYTGTTETFILSYGKMMLPMCSDPQPRPVLAVVVCVGFVIFALVVLLHAVIAGVVGGIWHSLVTLSQRMSQDLSKPLEAASRLPSLYANPHLLSALLYQAWREMDLRSRGYRAKYSRYHTCASLDTASQDCNIVSSWQLQLSRLLDWAGQTLSPPPRLREKGAGFFAVAVRSLTHHPLYRAGVTTVVLTSVALEAYCIEHDDEGSEDTLHILDTIQSILQFLFSADLLLRMSACYPQPKLVFFSKPLNFLDTIVLAVTWVGVVAFWISGQMWRGVGVLRCCRVARGLSLTDATSQSLTSSWRTMRVVLVLWVVFMFAAGVAGVLLFRDNDPIRFGSLLRAAVTVLQVATLDGWVHVAYTNMLGCDHYGYNSGIVTFDARCDLPDGKGWLAAVYFLTIVLVSIFLFLSVLLAVLIFSSTLVLETHASGCGEGEAREVLAQQADHVISDAAVSICRELFEVFRDSEGGDCFDGIVNKKQTISMDRIVLLFDMSNVSHNRTLIQTSCERARVDSGEVPLFESRALPQPRGLDFEGFLYVLYLVGQGLLAEQSTKRRSNLKSNKATICPSGNVDDGVREGRCGKAKPIGNRRANSEVELDKAWENKDRFSLQNLKRLYYNEYLDGEVQDTSDRPKLEAPVKIIARHEEDPRLHDDVNDSEEQQEEQEQEEEEEMKDGMGGDIEPQHSMTSFVTATITTSIIDNQPSADSEETEVLEVRVDPLSDNSCVFDRSYLSTQRELCPSSPQQTTQSSFAGPCETPETPLNIAVTPYDRPQLLSAVSLHSPSPGARSRPGPSFSPCLDAPARTGVAQFHPLQQEAPPPDPSRMHEEEWSFVRPHMPALISKPPLSSPGGAHVKYLLTPGRNSPEQRDEQQVEPRALTLRAVHAGDFVEALQSGDQEPVFAAAVVLSRHDPPTTDDGATVTFTLRFASGDISRNVPRVAIRFSDEEQRGKLRVGDEVLASCKSMQGRLMPGLIAATSYSSASYTVHFELFHLVGNVSEGDCEDDYSFDERVQRDAMYGMHYQIIA